MIQTNARKCFFRVGRSDAMSKWRTFPIRENIALARDFELKSNGRPSTLIHNADSEKLKDLNESRGLQGFSIKRAPRKFMVSYNPRISDLSSSSLQWKKKIFSSFVIVICPLVFQVSTHS